jgi:predicted membrane protein
MHFRASVYDVTVFQKAERLSGILTGVPQNAMHAAEVSYNPVSLHCVLCFVSWFRTQQYSYVPSLAGICFVVVTLLPTFTVLSILFHVILNYILYTVVHKLTGWT